MKSLFQDLFWLLQQNNFEGDRLVFGFCGTYPFHVWHCRFDLSFRSPPKVTSRSSAHLLNVVQGQCCGEQ